MTSPSDARVLRLVRDAFSPERLRRDADAYDLAADSLVRMGVPGGDVHERDAGYRRGVEYGHQITVVRLRELARARRLAADEAERAPSTWEVNQPPRPAA